MRPATRPQDSRRPLREVRQRAGAVRGTTGGPPSSLPQGLPFHRPCVNCRSNAWRLADGQAHSTVSIAVVVVVIAVVAIFGYVYLSGSPQPDDAQRLGGDAQRLSDISNLKDALNNYFNDNHSYPPTPGGECSGNYNNVVNLSSALVPKYISSIPKDPNPRACAYNYLYAASPDGKGYVLMVDLDDIDPATYSDRWCIGASSGTVAGYSTSYRPCP